MHTPQQEGSACSDTVTHTHTDTHTDTDSDSGECLIQPVLITGACDLFPATALFSVPGVAQVLTYMYYCQCHACTYITRMVTKEYIPIGVCVCCRFVFWSPSVPRSFPLVLPLVMLWQPYCAVVSWRHLSVHTYLQVAYPHLMPCHELHSPLLSD
jgi:hypothetical protein